MNGYNLSPYQQHIWSLQQQGRVRCHQLLLSLEGPLQLQQLKSALAEVVKRHEMLRTSFVNVPGLLYPLQAVNEAHSGAAWYEAQGVDQGWTTALPPYSNDPQRTCQLDVLLIRQTATAHQLVLRLPALCADGYTLLHLAEEIAELYCNNGRSLSALPPSFVQFAAWHQETLQQEEHTTAPVRAVDLRAALPYNVTPHQEGCPQWQSACLGLAESLQEQLLRAADKNGVTLQALLLACWQTWLCQYQESGHVVQTGVLIPGRSADLFKYIKGPLGLVLPLTIVADPLRSLSEGCRLSARALQELEEESYYRHVGQQGQLLSGAPGFEYYERLQPLPEGNGLHCKVLALDTEYEQFPLKLLCFLQGRQLQLQLTYDSRVFTGSAAAMLKANFASFLERAVMQPDQPLTAAASPLEMQYLLNDFKGPAVTLPAWQDVAACFEAKVRQAPDMTAVMDDHVSYTYRTLNAKVNRLAHFLIRQYGIKPGDVIAIRMERSPALIIALLAVVKTGAAFLPVDVSTPAARLEYMLKDSGAVLLLADDQQQTNNMPDTDPRVPLTEDPLLYVIYTSGSTGMPKGVMVHQRSFMNYISWFIAAHGISEKDSTALFSSVAFDLCYTALWSCLLGGGSLYLYREEPYIDAEQLLKDIIRRQVTYIKLTPSHLQMLCQSAGFDASFGQAALRLIVCGGEAIQPSDLEKCYALNSRMVIVNHYGPTETTIGAVACSLTPEDLSWFRRRPVIGKPIWNNRVYIVDAGNSLLPPGIAGEICIAGAGVAAGYLNRRELSLTRFIDDPFEAGGRMYRTGDLGRWTPEGNIVFLGRIDDQVKIRGHRVELQEISSCLGAHEQVKEAVVTVSKNDPSVLVAYYTADAPVDPAGLLSYLADRLPAYMLPAAFIHMRSFPLTPNGKLDKKALPAIDQAIDNIPVAYVAPNGLVETQLETIWCELLQKSRISADDHFFSIGGHSLKAVQLLSRIRETFQVKLALRDLFDHPTINRLATRISEAGHVLAEDIVPLPDGGLYELSHAQQGIWMLDQLGDAFFAFNMPAVYALSGAVDRHCLQDAFCGLIDRHEILRTCFVQENGTPCQQVLPPGHTAFRLSFHDLRNSADREEKLKQLTAQAVGQLFDLEQGPLIYAKLIQSGNETYTLIINLHHIVADAWSFEIMMHELALLYEAGVTGQQAVLPPLRIQYKDYTAWANRQLSGAQLSLHRRFWMQQFSDGIPELHFPLDFERPQERTYAGHAIGFVFEPAECTALRKLAATGNATLFMLFTALVKLLLYRYTGREDIVIGTPVSGRWHKELEAQVGLYLNNLPVRTAFNPAAPFTALLSQVRSACMDAFEHQAYPFDLIVSDLKCKRQPGRSPLFDVVVVMTTRNIDAGADNRLHNVSLERLDTAVPNGSTADMRFYFRETGEQLSCGVEYNTDLFTAQSMYRLLQHFRQTVDRVLANNTISPEMLRIADLTIF